MPQTTTKKLHLYQPKSPLAYADTMNEELLSEFDSTDIEAYEKEEVVMFGFRKEDITSTQTVIEEVSQGLKFLFGDQSKQLKYIERALTKGETICDSHYDKFVRAERVEKLIDSAKLKHKGQATQVGLSETNVEELNSAIAYLTEKGFTFGRDFTAHNAIDISKAHYLEQCHLDGDLVSLSNDVADCKECELEYEKGNVNLSAYSLSCCCYEDKPLDINFKDNAPQFYVYGETPNA